MMSALHLLPHWLFWTCAALLAYVFAGYPALCCLRARLRRRRWRARAGFTPSVSVVIAAYNEERDIAKRIRNVAAQQRDFTIELLIGSDGSTDRTVALARRAAAELNEPKLTIRIFDLPRSGKLGTLAHLISEATGNVIVFSDANCRFADGALPAIVAPLADPSIACAGGVKQIDHGHLHTAAGEKSYWGFENSLKQWESAIASCNGADGALYAVRKRDIPPLVTNRLLADDLYISLAVCAPSQQNPEPRRCVLVPEAIVYEASDTSADRELHRKARILAGALAAIAQCPRLLLPGSGLALALWSHKLLRWFAFVPLALMFLSALALPRAFAELFYSACIFAATLVWMGSTFPRSLRLTPIKLFFYFAVMNFGQVLGIVEWFRHGDQASWEKVR